ncbi:prolyl oligopeptidase family serine peptidase, partial [Bacillus subtilis subsp. subtilis]|nr:prolyl oligopeptidase family serine peptidase [Bacillus subtilis subsp. subtilis]
LNALHEGLKRAFPTRTVTVDTYNDDLSKVLFITDSPADSPAYHILVNGKDVVALGSEQPWIDPARIGEQRWVVYTARDGLKIPAVLDLPAGWKPGDAPLPAIVHPHGGPWARDSTGWDHGMMVPFLTTRGYAVLRPNYRGSTGLGRALTLAGDREWGQKMQDDKDDGAAWMVSQGIAAQDRIAIYGYSYGGFAAAAAVVRSPSPYQCAVSGAPVTDLAKLSHAWGDSRLQRIGQGKTVAGMDPMRNTDKAALPVLLFVGDRDVRTPAFHARNFHNAVKDRVSSTFVLIPDMPHGMPWYPRHVEESFGLVERFLKNDCGPGGL